MSSATHATNKRAFVGLLFGALCISFAAILVKAIGEERLGPSAIGFWRLLFGSIVLFIWSAIEARRVLIPRRILLWAVLAGFAFFCDLFFWHRSIFLTGAGMATILVATQVFAGAVIGYFAFHVKLTVRFFVAALFGFVGVSLLIGVGSASVVLSGNYLLGVFFGLLTGFFYASYIAVLKQASQEHFKFGTIALVAWVSLFAAIFLAISGAIEPYPFKPPDARTVLYLVALGIVPQAVGWRVISSSLPHVDNHIAGLTLLLQPVLATIWGALIFGETLAPLQIVGAAITLGAIYIGSIGQYTANEKGGS